MRSPVDTGNLREVFERIPRWFRGFNSAFLLSALTQSLVGECGSHRLYGSATEKVCGKDVSQGVNTTTLKEFLEWELHR